MGNDKASDWAKLITDTENLSSSDIEAVANSAEWALYANAGFLSLILFLIAASRSKDGDIKGAFFAALGAVICAVAPIAAKVFSIGV